MYSSLHLPARVYVYTPVVASREDINSSTGCGTGFRCQKHVPVETCFRAGPERYCNMFLRPKQAIKEAQRQALEIDGTVSRTTQGNM
ncbi:hypothetical protein AVEN_260826-1 [Araneus ventricosus]|uniref:Uncharacterized protein n=1 Tax=Araneus ventricosus TaxID=182803 RepID=A0A4Y2RG61_ARAVE|nr:hypothetical protein AVEN_260824-1 [Araneus ventricosus]GBN74370.1 hypothetical protein AVEN_260826-1 [Araneus ventricosus]